MKTLQDALKVGEAVDIEFKSWIKTSSMKERISLAVDELIAFANCKGGTVYFGVEDDGEVTGCTGKYDLQSICESIYDKTRPPMFTDIEEIEYDGKTVIAITVEADGKTYATTDGRCLKRLGKNSKPFYSDEMAHIYSIEHTNDFSSQIIAESSIDDINLLVVYALKEKLKLHDPVSTLPDLDDMAFLKDLKLIANKDGQIKLTIAGLLFVGKDISIQKLLPQAEVIYLHYGKDNLEEYNARIDMKQPIITILDRLTEKIENENKGINMEEGRVPSTVFFLMNDGNKILGHISIRHNIDNAFLKLYGGHIGYGIRPSERNKGYGTIMLHLALIKCKELGLEDVMITCKDNNVGSYKTIENNYGIQKDLIYIKEENSYFRRYWINIDQSVLSFKML